MSKFFQSPLSRYGMAIVAVVSALILTLALGTSALLQPSLLFLVAVMISAWYGGVRAGLLSVALSALAIGYFFLPPVYSLMAGLSDTLRIILFGVVAGPISLIISARKRFEERLRKSEELHRITLSNISDAIFLTDGKGDFTYVCPNVHVIFGYSESEVEAFGNIRRLLGKGWFDPHELETAGEIINIEREITDKVGARHVVLVNVKRVAIKDGTVLYACREITQRKQAEEEQTRRIREESARAEAEAANRAKDEFLAMVSHELRSPLNAMFGWARLLHDGKLNEATVMHAGEVIERNARSQAQLIEDLLDISRIVAGNLRLDLHEIDLATVIEAAVEDVSPAAEAKAIQIQTSLDPAAGPVLGDRCRLKQVVWNLLSNAVKFTPQGGSVDVRLARAESGARITVSDTGKGIKAEFLPHIFDRYRQEGQEASKGLGLGLNIVRSLVEAHGGTVQAESRGEGQGAAFTVTLPWAGALPEPTPDGGFNKSKMRRAGS
ncbi:MAG TPA: ATP-binding protein [Blastocatellia bacterium]|nr:ATP-binding protein [Blastocatellia bacterium]